MSPLLTIHVDGSSGYNYIIIYNSNYVNLNLGGAGHVQCNMPTSYMSVHTYAYVHIL